MFRARRAVIGAIMGAGTAAMLMPKPARAATPSPDFSYLEDRLRQRVEAGYFSGMGLQIGRGETVLNQAYFGDGDPSRVLHVASMGKWVAAATIAAVVDTGRLGWSDTARTYIPELTDMKGEATLPHLLAAKPQAPVLILRGDRERAGFSLTDLVRAQVHVIPNCGHLSNMDRPAAFNRAVLSFLR